MIGLIPAELSETYWPVVAPLIEKVVAEYDPGYATEDLLNDVLKGRKQLWVAATDHIACAVITEINNYPQYKVLHAPYVAGDDMEQWLPRLLQTLEKFGRAHGCKYVTGCGRRGWVKALSSYGWSEGFTIVRKEL